jgi:hypothetical protein
LERLLANLKNSSIRVTAGNVYTDAIASVRLLFSNGSKLRADYWRIIKDGKAGRSSFDHQQQYGLAAPIDAIKDLQEELQCRVVTDAQFDKETGDLLFQLSENVRFQVFNFSSYEVWDMCFPDDSEVYSTFIRRLPL